MIIGISMVLETCLILGQVSHTIYSTGRESSRRIYVVRVEINDETASNQSSSSVARARGINGKARQAKGEAKVV